MRTGFLGGGDENVLKFGEMVSDFLNLQKKITPKRCICENADWCGVWILYSSRQKRDA